MRILLIHASAGAGHRKAAEAIRDALVQQGQHNVELVDALDFSTKWFKLIYSGSYSFLITNIPLLWGFFFALVDIPILQPLIRVVRRIQNGLNVRGLHEYLIKEDFDCIITTHFMPNEIVSAIKKAGKIRSKLITCVTDYDVHRIWLAKEIDQYCVASEWTKNKLIRLGVDTDRIAVTGIPCHSKFTVAHDIAALKNKLELDKEGFTILVATGSFGIGPIETIINTLTDFQVIVVCGHNQSLYTRLNERPPDHLKVMGLVDNMDELMAVADAMVTKPGGLSITEALVSQLPLFFFNAIPGQETNNIKVLDTYNIGISHCNISEIAKKLRELRSSVDLYQLIITKTQALAKPQAVWDIISHIE